MGLICETLISHGAWHSGVVVVGKEARTTWLYSVL